uniref:ATP synthase-coupling factor 6, mitochondrial n=1 Tax=Acrobeloides nanus TaxID=290746 RepID=A0A914EKR8_9BILA
MLRNTVQCSRAFSTSGIQRQQAKTKDIIADAFLKQIRAVTEKQRAAGGSLISTSPELKKELDDQLSRLAAKYHISSIEEVGKLDVKLEQPKVENSAKVLLEPDEAPKEEAKVPATSTVSYFENIVKTDHPERSKYYVKWMEKGWTPEEKAEYEQKVLWQRKFMTPEFVAKLQALAAKGPSSEDTFETRLKEAKQ